MLEMAITLQPSDAIFGYRGRERREGKGCRAAWRGTNGEEEGPWSWNEATDWVKPALSADAIVAR